MSKRSFRWAGVLALMAVLVNAAWACPVCYGDVESTSADGINAAVLVLLGITGGVLTLLTALFLRIRKRVRMTMNGSVDYPSVN